MSSSANGLGRVTIVSLLANIGLFGIKLYGFLLSGSVALLSDAVNSFVDIISSIGVLVSVRVARKAPDREHQFGHARAEPIAGFVMAIAAAVLGIEVMQESVVKFFVAHQHRIEPVLFAILGVAIICKLALSAWQMRVGKRERSPALVASAVDSRNDVLSSLAALVGITGAYFGYLRADEISGVIVGVLIVWGGIRTFRDNLDMLLGRAPADALLERIRAVVAGVEGVEEIRFCRGHFVGNELHLEIIIACRGDLSTTASSDIADVVRQSAEADPEVDMAFVHVDTVESPHHYPELMGEFGGGMERGVRS
jgi:cation diffusion facilitator family transporter